jgi:hypothetical protein
VNHSIDIAKEAVLPGEKYGATPRNIVSEALVKFFELLSTPVEKTRFNVNKQEEDIPLFGLEKEVRRLLVIPSNCTNRLKDYFKQLALRAYSIDTIELNRQGFLFVDTELSNKALRSDRFFHVMYSIFKHPEIGWKVEVDKLLTSFSPDFVKYFEGNSEPKIKTNGELRNCIEETCFATGVEEMREFLFRTPAASMLHNLFHKVPEDQQSALRLIVGSYLAGDISLKILNIILREFLPYTVPPIDSITEEVDNQIQDRMKNPLWKYLENRKILIIEDRLDYGENKWEGWDVVFPAIFLSPEKYSRALCRELPSTLFKKMTEKENGFQIEITHYKKMIDLLSARQLNLEEFDLILLDLYSSIEHNSAMLPTNIKHPMWQLIEKLNYIRIDHTIPKPLPQVVIFSRESRGITTRTMFKELNAADYFFKITRDEEHKCGYYSSFRNAVLSALKENIYQVGGMTGIPSRLHFNKWLRQFDPCDRPLILHLMKHFKYFPAANIMKLLDYYLEKNTRWEDGTVSILNSSPRKSGRFYISYLGHINKSGPATLPLLSKTKWIRELRIKNQGSKKLPGLLSYEDLQQKIKKDIKSGNLKHNPLCLIFVDDFVGSGGQLKDYIKKFIFYLICGESGGNFKNYFKRFVHHFIKYDKKKLDQVKNLEIIALYALGAQNEKFEGKINNNERNNDETNSINGTLNLEFSEGFSPTVQVHVAHYARSIQEIFKDNQGFLRDVKETLSKYSVIMDLRDEDYPCDFETWGWEKNGGLIATYANTPGNTVPVIWQDYKSKNESDVIPQENGLAIKEWKPLYPRYFNPLTPGIKRDNQDLECSEKKDLKCPANPEKWDKCFFEEYWGNENNENPPCKIKN